MYAYNMMEISETESSWSVYSDCDCYLCQLGYNCLSMEMDTYPRYPAINEPFVYFAQCRHGKLKDCRDCKRPNCFVRAFRWYTNEHTTPKQRGKPCKVQRPCPEPCSDECSEPIGTSLDHPNISAFATWLDSKYHQFLTENAPDVCRNNITEASVIKNCNQSPRDCYESYAKKFFMKKNWIRRKQKCQERDCPNNEEREVNNFSMEFILTPKNISHAASECCRPFSTPTCSVDRHIVKSRSATATVSLNKTGYDNQEYVKPPVEQKKSVAKQKHPEKYAEAACQCNAPYGQSVQTQYDMVAKQPSKTRNKIRQIPSKPSVQSSRRKKSNIMCECPAEIHKEKSIVQDHTKQQFQSAGPLASDQQPQHREPSANLQKPCPDFQRPCPSLVMSQKDHTPCPSVYEPCPGRLCPSFRQPCPPSPRPNIQQTKQTQTSSTYSPVQYEQQNGVQHEICADFRKPCPNLREPCPSVCPKARFDSQIQRQRSCSVQYQENQAIVHTKLDSNNQYQQVIPNETSQLKMKFADIQSKRRHESCNDATCSDRGPKFVKPRPRVPEMPPGQKENSYTINVGLVEKCPASYAPSPVYRDVCIGVESCPSAACAGPCKTCSSLTQGPRDTYRRETQCAEYHCPNCSQSRMNFDGLKCCARNDALLQPGMIPQQNIIINATEGRCSLKCPYYTTMNNKVETTQTERARASSTKFIQTSNTAITLNRNNPEYKLFMRVVCADKLK